MTGLCFEGKNVPNGRAEASFDAVSLNSAAKLLRNRQAHARERQVIGEDLQRET